MAQHIRILMVEDSPHDAKLVERELRRANLDFSLQRVDSEQELRAALQSSDPDVILGDYNLPGFDGIEALKIAHSLMPDTPFIFVSGSIGEERAVQTLREGATDYILKDRLSRLASAITRAIDQRRERQLLRRAQEALQQSEERFQFAAKATQEVIWDWDVVTGRVSFNDALATAWGYHLDSDQVTIEWRQAHIHPDDQQRVTAALRSAMEREDRWSATYRFQRSDGSYGEVLDHAVIVRNARGDAARVITAMLDITERKRLEKQIEQASRVTSLGRVAATIAHEFNNVLMGIQPLAEVIRRDSQEEKQQKAASQIINSVARGRRVTQEILRFTQPSEPALQPVDLHEWIEQLIPEMLAMIGQRIRIEIEAPKERVIVRCDSAQMQQVVTNLVLNARDAMPNGGTITILIAPSGAGMALLSVRDTGIGMVPEILQNVFEPLFTTKRAGTGLGLAVAQQIVSRHAGSIHAESTPGVGTTFSILLPMTAEATPQQVETAHRAARPRALLLVEDDADVAAGITTLLEGEGIRVDTVELGAKVIDAIAEGQPDAVILDVTLPDMSGVGLYENIARRWPDLPVLFSTGLGDERTPDAYSNAHNIGFLRKPYDLETLLDALEKIMSRQPTRGA